MNYYTVAFCYPVPEVNDMDCDPNKVSNVSIVLSKYDELAEKAGRLAGLNIKHSYGWPDGSLYKYVQTELDHDAVKKLINAELQKMAPEMWVSHVQKTCPAFNPYKYLYATIHNFMEGIRSDI